MKKVIFAVTPGKVQNQSILIWTSEWVNEVKKPRSVKSLKVVFKMLALEGKKKQAGFRCTLRIFEPCYA